MNRKEKTAGKKKNVTKNLPKKQMHNLSKHLRNLLK